MSRRWGGQSKRLESNVKLRDKENLEGSARVGFGGNRKKSKRLF